MTVIGAGLQRWSSGSLFLKPAGLGNPFLAETRKDKSQHIDYNVIFFCTLKGIGKLDLAIRDFNEAIKHNPHDAFCYNERGIAYAEKGDLSRAISDFKASLGYDPSHTPARDNLERTKRLIYMKEIDNFLSAHSILYKAEQLLNSGNLDEAENYFYKGLDKAEKDNNLELQSISCCGLGRILCERKQYIEALILFKKSLSLAEQVGLGGLNLTSKIYNEIAIVRRRQGEYAKAIEIFKKLIDIDKGIGTDHDVAVDYGNLGNVYLQQNDFESAIEAYEKGYEHSEKAGDHQMSSRMFEIITKIRSFLNMKEV